MRQLILCLLITSILLSGCSEATIEQEAPAPDRNVIEFVAFGASEKPAKQNKGFDAAYYCYLDFNKDSVFVQKRVNLDDQFKTLAWSGTIEGLSQNQKLLNFIEASQQTRNGNIVSTLPNGSFFYDGYHYYSSYRKGSSDKFHYYTTHDLESRFENGVDYIMAMYQHEKLKPVASFVNLDSIVAQLVNRPNFSEGRLLPPPPIRAKVNYTPPIVKKP